jgi:streptogramin lyase
MITTSALGKLGLAVALAVGMSACSDNEGSSPGATGGAGGTGSGGRGGSAGAGSGGSSGSGGVIATGGTSGGGGGASGGSGGGTGGGSAGAGGSVDGGSGGAPGDAGGEGGPGPGDGPASAVKCGDMITPVMGTGAAEGVVITPDGTMYYSQSFSANTSIGRYRPGMAAEPNFIPNVGAQVLGITYDPKRKILYAGRRSNAAVLKIDLKVTPPTVATLAPAEADINGMTLGEDDAVYYSDQTGRNIHRVTPEGMKTKVNTTPLPGEPNGIAFGPDKALYVVYWAGTQQVTKLTLTNGAETARAVFLASLGAGNADGAAFDEMGRLYVTAGGMLRRIAANGASVDMMMASNGANIDFGAGALKCTDVYVGSNGGGIRRHALDVKGMDVPWHREAP